MRGLADAAAAAAAGAQGRAAAGGPAAGETGQEYCLTVVGYLAGLLFPGGIGSGQVRDDGLAGAGRSAGRYLGVPAVLWGPVAGWAELSARVGQAGPGAAAFVVISRPGRDGHALALVRTGDGGLAVVNPAIPGQHSTGPLTGSGTGPLTGLLGPLTGRLGPVAEVRALVVGPAGQVVPPAASASVVRALTDPAHPRISGDRTAQHASGTGSDAMTAAELRREDTREAVQLLRRAAEGRASQEDEARLLEWADLLGDGARDPDREIDRWVTRARDLGTELALVLNQARDALGREPAGAEEARYAAGLVLLAGEVYGGAGYRWLDRGVVRRLSALVRFLGRVRGVAEPDGYLPDGGELGEQVAGLGLASSFEVTAAEVDAAARAADRYVQQTNGQLPDSPAGLAAGLEQFARDELPRLRKADPRPVGVYGWLLRWVDELAVTKVTVAAQVASLVGEAVGQGSGDVSVVRRDLESLLDRLFGPRPGAEAAAGRDQRLGMLLSLVTLWLDGGDPVGPVGLAELTRALLSGTVAPGEVVARLESFYRLAAAVLKGAQLTRQEWLDLSEVAAALREEQGLAPGAGLVPGEFAGFVRRLAGEDGGEGMALTPGLISAAAHRLWPPDPGVPVAAERRVYVPRGDRPSPERVPWRGLDTAPGAFTVAAHLVDGSPDSIWWGRQQVTARQLAVLVEQLDGYGQAKVLNAGQPPLLVLVIFGAAAADVRSFAASVVSQGGYDGSVLAAGSRLEQPDGSQGVVGAQDAGGRCTGSLVARSGSWTPALAARWPGAGCRNAGCW